jgi:hypothetical protein
MYGRTPQVAHIGNPMMYWKKLYWKARYTINIYNVYNYQISAIFQSYTVQCTLQLNSTNVVKTMD